MVSVKLLLKKRCMISRGLCRTRTVERSFQHVNAFVSGFMACLDFTEYAGTFLSITHTLGDRHRCVDVDLLRDEARPRH